MPTTCCTAPAPSRPSRRPPTDMAARRADVLVRRTCPTWWPRTGRRAAGLRLLQLVQAAPGLPLLGRGLDLPAPTTLAGRGSARALLAALSRRRRSGRRAQADRGDRRLGQRRFHRRAPRARASRQVGVLKACGWKFGDWRDVVLMEKAAGRRHAPRPKPFAMKNKTLAAWLAFLGGPLGLHRFYLHGWSTCSGWLLPIPTALGPLRHRAGATSLRRGRPVELGH